MTDQPQDLNPLQERIRAYLDDELSPAERAEFDVQLEQNAELKAEFELQRSTVELLHRMGPLSAPETLLPAIQKRLAGRHMRENYGPTIRFPYEVLAFVIMLGCVFYLYFTQLPGSPGPITQRAKPQLVEIELTRPAGSTLEDAFQLKLLKTDRPFERTVYGTYSKEDAVRLLTELEPLLKSPQSLPKSDAEDFSMVITSPLK